MVYESVSVKFYKLHERNILDDKCLCFIVIMPLHWLEQRILISNPRSAIIKQLAAGGVGQSGSREFDPRRVHDNWSLPFWIYMRFPLPEHQN